MQFEAAIAITFVVTITTFLFDWPRAFAGLALGAIASNLPFGTIVIPVSSIAIAGIGELGYSMLDRTHPNLGSFVIGLISAFGTASTLFVTIRNFKERL